ncbi:MAG: ABC transporter ATP-binding protein [Deltaproteobacteria bacterium]
MPFLIVDQLSKKYPNDNTNALKGISFSMLKGEIVAVVGPSGCGKSTLLNLIGYLDLPTSGKILVNGKPVGDYGPAHTFRSKMVGFVFQYHHMVSGMTLAENVAAPLIAQGVGKLERRRRALEHLENVGLGHRAHFLPNLVSGGERQRAAVARALITSPSIILADEPTGNLDSSAGEAVFKLMLAQSRLNGSTVIIATHNLAIAAMADRIIQMRDGELISPA